MLPYVSAGLRSHNWTFDLCEGLFTQRTDDKEALLRLPGYSGVKRNQRSASNVATKWDQERGASCLLWRMLAFVRGNAEEEKSRVGEGSLCL